MSYSKNFGRFMEDFSVDKKERMKRSLYFADSGNLNIVTLIQRIPKANISIMSTI